MDFMGNPRSLVVPYDSLWEIELSEPRVEWQAGVWEWQPSLWLVPCGQRTSVKMPCSKLQGFSLG